MSNAQQEKLLQSAAVAAREGNIDELGNILRQSPEVLDARDSEGQTLLILACKAATGDMALPPVPSTPGATCRRRLHTGCWRGSLGE